MPAPIEFTPVTAGVWGLAEMGPWGERVCRVGWALRSLHSCLYPSPTCLGVAKKQQEVMVRVHPPGPARGWWLVEGQCLMPAALAGVGLSFLSVTPGGLIHVKTAGSETLALSF